MGQLGITPSSQVGWAVTTNEIVTPGFNTDPGIWAVNTDSGGSRRIEELGGDVLGSSRDGSRLVIYHGDPEEYGILDVESGEFLAFPASVLHENKTRLGTTILTPPDAYFLADREKE
jgi:hypothetical protein